MNVYGLSEYDYEGYESSREYFSTAKERDERVVERSRGGRYGKEKIVKFDLSLPKEMWKLNYHGIARDKSKILELKEEVRKLKQKLVAKIKIAFDL